MALPAKLPQKVNGVTARVLDQNCQENWELGDKMPGPNWLNAWVRVNAKHVTSPESSGGSSEPSKNGPDAKAADGSDPSTSTAPTTDTTPREESVSVTSSARVTRKGRRRLQKTRSASDLLREMAVRDVGSPSANKYLNEAAFILQLEQRKQLDSPDSKAYLRARYSPAVSPPPPPPPLPARATTAPQGGGLKLFPPSFLMGDNNSSNDKSECSRCKALEEQLRVAETDVEYLRVTALQNEYQCASCQQAKKASPPWSAPQALTPSEGSKQLVAVTHRHKKQIEQLTRERVSLDETMVVLRNSSNSIFFCNSHAGNKICISSCISLPTFVRT